MFNISKRYIVIFYIRLNILNLKLIFASNYEIFLTPYVICAKWSIVHLY